MSPLLRIPLTNIPPVPLQKVGGSQHHIRIPQTIEDEVSREALGVVIGSLYLLAVFAPVEADQHTVIGPRPQGVCCP